MLKKFFISLLSAIIISTSSLPMLAEGKKNQEDFQDKFIQNIYSSKTYLEYKDYIDSKFVDRVAETDVGTRRTIVYKLKTDKSDEEMTIVYVGDEQGNIVDNLLSISNNDELACINLLTNIKTSVNFDDRAAAYICYKEACSYYIDPPTFNSNDQGCSFFLGKTCDVAALFGHPIAAIVCKGGVWIACHVSRNKVCAKFVEYQDVCTL